MDIKLKVLSALPAQIFGGTAITVAGSNGNYVVSLDYSKVLKEHALPAAGQTLVYDAATHRYFRVNVPIIVSAPFITVTPSPIIVNDTASVGTAIGTISVSNAIGTYTFSLTTNPGGKYQIIGNQLQVAAPLTAGTDTIVIHADNGMGSTADLTVPITVRHLGAYVPTYYIYGF